MARYSIDEKTLTDIADAVRAKVGIEGSLKYVQDVICDTGKITVSLENLYGQRFRITVSDIVLAEGCGYIQMNWKGPDSPYGSAVNLSINYSGVKRLNPKELMFFSQNNIIGSTFHLVVEAVDENDIPYTMTPLQMAEAIDEMMGIPEEALFLTGDCSYRLSQNGWNWFIEQCGDKITAQDISNPSYMFANSKTLREIPFSIYLSSSMKNHPASSMFSNCNQLINIPMIHSLKVQEMSSMFSGCNSISFFPENFAKDWDWSILDDATSAYTGSMSNLFTNCMKLREIPQELLIHGNPFWTYSYALTYGGFNNCYGLEKVENVFIPYKSTAMTASYSNVFNNTVKSCCRLKKFTLQTQQDGTPYDVSGWKSQTIDLSTVGYGSLSFMRLVGLTEETQIDNEEKWRGYIDGSYPDGWAASVEYSTFGATAVREFIASLPSITGGSNNTVKLKQGAASAIPGEEMTSLTEEDIAVATEKGWTITFV